LAPDIISRKEDPTRRFHHLSWLRFAMTPAIPTAVLLTAGTEISLLQAGFRELFGALAIVIVLLILWYRQERRERAQNVLR
jgi:hypothetical protein